MMDLSVIVAVDGDAHILEKNIFYRQELVHDPRIIAEASGSAGIFMESMMDSASCYIGIVCPKIAAMKNERTIKIFCEMAGKDEDSWPCTIFATGTTLPIVLEACTCNRLIIVAPHKRNADFTYRQWRLAESSTIVPKGNTNGGYDLMIYEHVDELTVSESDMDDELNRLCSEMDNDILEPMSDEDRAAIEKVLEFVKSGLTVERSHMDGFDNDYDTELDSDSIMKDVTAYVKASMIDYVKMPLFQKSLDIQNGILKRLGTVEDIAKELQQSMEAFRLSMSDTNSVCSEGIRRELEATNLKYNSVNERLDGIQTQLGNVVMETANKPAKVNLIQIIMPVVAILLAIIGIMV